MPRLDVTSVLLDPRFCDSTLQCERSTLGVDAQGRGITTGFVLTGFSGVVTSDRGSRLNRGVVGERVTDTITVITKFRLRDGGQAAAADIVRWAGLRWTVVAVNDYSTYGQGFIEATCEMIPLSG